MLGEIKQYLSAVAGKDGVKERRWHGWETRRISDREMMQRNQRGLESNPYPSLSALIILDVSEKHGTRV